MTMILLFFFVLNLHIIYAVYISKFVTSVLILIYVTFFSSSGKFDKVIKLIISRYDFLRHTRAILEARARACGFFWGACGGFCVFLFVVFFVVVGFFCWFFLGGSLTY